ncbi:hypothetical protein [Vibrio viridaestus]|uniref:Lipoprotein n=1 Tax=Vibrio viridaestus TaxID=2487322 RepID=A0A3N9TJ84_9VIBR|nr:hypothetical protein [Vibrio viridaestus]RQW64349.1 hypothetical protein EES38_07155 [Vibrio viridaestus]
MVKRIITLSMLALTGCVSVPTDTPPKWHENSDQYVIKGRQGWMPGHHLTFGPYQVDVDKSANLNLIDDVLLKVKHQSVTMTLSSNDSEQAQFHYEQRCDGGHGSLVIIEPNKYAAQIDAQGKKASFTDPYNFSFNDQQYHLAFGDTDHPQVITIMQNKKALAELHLGVFNGSLSAQDKVWLMKEDSQPDTAIGALLVGYAATYEPSYCDDDE